MKNIISNLSMALAVFAAFSACSNEMDESSHPQTPLQIKTEIQSTRAGIDATQFENNDVIGLFVSKNGKLTSDGANVSASTKDNGKSWSMSAPIMLDQTSAVVYAYYPWQEKVNTEYGISFNLDVASQTNYLYGISESVNNKAPIASINFKHALNKVGFVINNDENLKVSKVSISGSKLPTAGLFNVSSLSFEPTSYGTIVSKNINQVSESICNVYFLVAPMGNLQLTLRVEYTGAEDKVYEGSFTAQGVSIGQNVYYTVTVKKDEPIEISKATITDWSGSELLNSVIATKQ